MGLFTLIKRLRGKKPRIGDQQPEGVVFEADHIRLYVPTDVARLYSDKPMRDQLEAFIRPLTKEGIDRVVFRQDKTELESVQREEVGYFNAEFEGADVTETIIPRQRLEIVSPVLNGEGKWRLNDGANTHWYAMEDKEFAEAIKNGKRFGKYDILVCEVLMTQRLDETNHLRLEHAVRRVLQHTDPGQQVPFPDTDSN